MKPLIFSMLLIAAATTWAQTLRQEAVSALESWSVPPYNPLNSRRSPTHLHSPASSTCSNPDRRLRPGPRHEPAATPWSGDGRIPHGWWNSISLLSNYQLAAGAHHPCRLPLSWPGHRLGCHQRSHRRARTFTPFHLVRPARHRDGRQRVRVHRTSLPLGSRCPSGCAPRL